MIKNFFFLMILEILCIKGYSQNRISDQLKLGSYNTLNDSHNNRFHYEELTLKQDHAFKYFARNEFVKVEKEGKWKIDSDTLILNEINPEFEKVSAVVESYDKYLPKRTMAFEVRYFDKSTFKYQLTVSHSDTIIILTNQEKQSKLPLSKVDEISISGSLYSYPPYQVKDQRSNKFIINVASRPSFVSEKWLIEKGNRIRPKSSSGFYVNYFLSFKEN